MPLPEPSHQASASSCLALPQQSSRCTARSITPDWQQSMLVQTVLNKQLVKLPVMLQQLVMM